MRTFLRRLLAGAVVLSLLTAACGGGSDENAPPEAIVMVLFDLSKSTAMGDIRGLYLAEFETVLAGVERELEGARGAIVVAADFVDGNPLAHPGVPVNVRFDPYKGATQENPAIFKARIRRVKEETLAVADDLIHQPQGIGGTAILDSLELAERFFATYPGARRSLVIFSDMVEFSDRHRFKRKNLTDEAIAAFVKMERSQNLLPDLRGVNVCVSGAGAVVSGRQKPARFRAIRRFWLRYFEASGAKLPKSQYGSELIKFPCEGGGGT